MRLHGKTLPRGFTLIELLVVLVIMSITTTLLVEGLGTTWRNFDKLSGRQLMSNSAQLPKQWFSDSFAGIQLYHPDVAVFSGSEYEVEFITTTAPNNETRIPQVIKWRLFDDDGARYLQILTPANSTGINENDQQNSNGKQETWETLAELPLDAKFEYYHSDGKWHPDFSSDRAELPLAVKITINEKIWHLTSMVRPVNTPVIPEMVVFGRYVF